MALAEFMFPLEAELTDDPLGRGYSTMTDQEVADSLNAQNREQYRRVPMTEIHNWASAKRLHSRFADTATDAAIDGPLYKELILLLEGKQDSVNFQSSESGVSSLINDMVVNGVMTEAESTELQSLGTYYISRGKEIGFAKNITAQTIANVRS